MKYRKKPVVIEAFQMTRARMESSDQWPWWLREAWRKHKTEPGGFGAYYGIYRINTLEGTHLVSPNDWIIRGVKGELYPCKPDIFEMTYEVVEDEE